MWSLHGVRPVTLADQIATLQNAPVAELAARYIEVFGGAPRSRRNAAWLRKRIAHRLQENAFGGLPRVARAALDRLVAQIQLPMPAATEAPAPSPSTEHRLRPGTVLQRAWHGKQVRVLVTADGFEWNGGSYTSLSAVAFAVTNSRWNGRLFFGLVERGKKA